ncbi:outer membrane lipoprotein-sorting protein [Methanosarcina sp. Z-7115]|uniref:Outer membrane lipoprotein-sorting protein n=1 Tax=Methanosarcina baikalica TaxID=3073890 RepID=A0ABU2D5U3_9EURY|nr:outer membrane lipoprotein-sorting protein [Methanosarcina sp. Z-7115]MDR7667292.1 outer membrane lipoprotein-sorting protein [Methanosarcina sp. Z-7115]
MLKKLLIVTLILSIVATGCISEMTVEEIAKHTQEKYETVHDFKATRISTTNVQGAEISDEVEISVKKPNKFMSEDKKRGIIKVSNGEVMWVYDVKKGEATRTSLEGYGDLLDYGSFIKELLEDTNATLLGEEKLSGTSCYVIEETPKKDMYLTGQKIWIDKKYWIPVRIEIYFEGFNSSVEYTNVSFNTGISDDEFEFSPPAGVKIIEPETKLSNNVSMEDAQNNMNFTILNPYTAGYEFNGATVSKSGDMESVSLVYTKGRERMAITQTVLQEKHPLQNAENVSIGEAEGELIHILGKKMLRFDSNDTEIMITGTMTKDEFIKVAESMNQ